MQPAGVWVESLRLRGAASSGRPLDIYTSAAEPRLCALIDVSSAFPRRSVPVPGDPPVNALALRAQDLCVRSATAPFPLGWA